MAAVGGGAATGPIVMSFGPRRAAVPGLGEAAPVVERTQLAGFSEGRLQTVAPPPAPKLVIPMPDAAGPRVAAAAKAGRDDDARAAAALVAEATSGGVDTGDAGARSTLVIAPLPDAGAGGASAGPAAGAATRAGPDAELRERLFANRNLKRPAPPGGAAGGNDAPLLVSRGFCLD